MYFQAMKKSANTPLLPLPPYWPIIVAFLAATILGVIISALSIDKQPDGYLLYINQQESNLILLCSFIAALVAAAWWIYRLKSRR